MWSTTTLAGTTACAFLCTASQVEKSLTRCDCSRLNGACLCRCLWLLLSSVSINQDCVAGEPGANSLADLGGILACPESPRFFLAKGDVEQARINLGRLRDLPVGDEELEDELQTILGEIQIEQAAENASYLDCFKSEDRSVYYHLMFSHHSLTYLQHAHPNFDRHHGPGRPAVVRREFSPMSPFRQSSESSMTFRSTSSFPTVSSSSRRPALPTRLRSKLSCRRSTSSPRSRDCGPSSVSDVASRSSLDLPSCSLVRSLLARSELRVSSTPPSAELS